MESSKDVWLLEDAEIERLDTMIRRTILGVIGCEGRNDVDDLTGNSARECESLKGKRSTA